MLEAAIFLQGFPRVNGQFFKASFADIFRNTDFLWCDSIYNVGSAQEVLAEYFKVAFDEAHFLVNLHSFL